MTLVSELDSSRQMSFNTFYLLSTNPILRRRYTQYMTDDNTIFKRERCSRFMFDSEIDRNLFNRTTDPFSRLRHWFMLFLRWVDGLFQFLFLWLSQMFVCLVYLLQIIFICIIFPKCAFGALFIYFVLFFCFDPLWMLICFLIK